MFRQAAGQQPRTGQRGHLPLCPGRAAAAPRAEPARGGSSPPPGQTLLTALVSYSTSFCTELIMGAAAAAGMAAAQGSGLAPAPRHGGGSRGCPSAAEGEAELPPERGDTTGLGTDATRLLPGRGKPEVLARRRRLHGRTRESACAAA